MRKPSRTPGISRIDQPEKHNHGYFVRLQRQGVIHSAFFADRQHGGCKAALAAAQAQHWRLLAKFGPPKRRTRRGWAELLRRRGRSGVIGVRRIVVGRGKSVRRYWMATWSPEAYVVRRKYFSIQEHGAEQAKLLAIRTRRAGVRNMKEDAR